MTASLTKVAIFIIFSLSEKLDLRMVQWGQPLQTWVSCQGGGRRILRVSVRGIKKRREIQAKHEGLVEDMRQEQR